MTHQQPASAAFHCPVAFARTRRTCRGAPSPRPTVPAQGPFGWVTSPVRTTGPVDALIAMLFDCGIFIDMYRFHQLESGDHTATFIQGSDGEHVQWAMGWSEDKADSALRAIIACANRLM